VTVSIYFEFECGTTQPPTVIAGQDVSDRKESLLFTGYMGNDLTIVMLCFQVENERRWRNISLPSSVSKNKPSKKPSKRRLTFNGLHGIISQKMVLFITTSVKTKNPEQRDMLGIVNDMSLQPTIAETIFSRQQRRLCTYCCSIKFSISRAVSPELSGY
jgi:hypothetical protein